MCSRAETGITADLNMPAGARFPSCSALDPTIMSLTSCMHPPHVRLKESEAGAHEALQIESESGVTTLLRFRSAMLPEAVDGVVLNR